MFRNNKGVTLAVLVVTIIVIMILAGVTVTTSDLLIKDTKAKAIISNMYLVKGKVETIYEEFEFSPTGTLPGTKVEVSSLSTYGVTNSVNVEENDNWYKWNKTVLEQNGLDPEMLSGSAEYVVNYFTGEVIYTAGVKDDSGVTKYKLTEIVETE